MENTTVKTARFVRQFKTWKADAKLFELSEPVEYEDGKSTKFVVVSAADVSVDNLFAFWGGTGPETFIFAYEGDGEKANMLELDGSFRGELNHAKALRNMGFEIAADV